MALNQQAAPLTKSYWIYWIVVFAIVLPWILAVVAAVDDAWLSTELTGSFFAMGDDCSGDGCYLLEGGAACQYVATSFISLALLFAFASAFMAPPLTGIFGIVVGILLVVFSGFQLVAVILISKFVNEYIVTFSYSSSTYYEEFETGPTHGVASTAFALGVAASITLLVLRRSGANHEGPFKRCTSGSAGGGGGTTQVPVAATHAPASNKTAPPPAYYETETV